MRAVLYVRDSQHDEEKISLALQEHAGRDYCGRQDYEVVDVVPDPGVSGRKWAKRPGVLRAIAMVEDDQADIIIVWKWSRLSRRRVDQALAYAKIEDELGGRVESSTEPIDTKTASGRLHRGMMNEFAAFESERYGEQWGEVYTERIGRGMPARGGARYGYRRERQPTEGRPGGENVYVVDDDQAETLTWMYAQVIGGRGSPWIAQELNRRGVPNPRGAAWKVDAVFDLLDSGFAAGLLVQGTRDGRADRRWAPGAHPPIIDEQTWTAYLAARRARSATPARALESPYPLTGLLFCGDCGAAMVVHSSNRHRPAIYSCNRWRAQGAATVRCVTVTQTKAETLVRDWLAGVAGDVERAAAADRKLTAALRTAATSARRARERATELDTELASLARLRARDELSADGYDTARRQLEAELADARATVDRAELDVARRPAPTLATAGRLLADWDVLPGVRIREVLRDWLLRGAWVFPPERKYGKATLVIRALWEHPPALLDLEARGARV